MNTTTAKVDDVFTAAAYAQAQTDEGSYEYLCGENVIARAEPDARGNVRTYIYTGEDSDLPFCFADKTAHLAAYLVEQINKERVITLEYWEHVETHNVHALPDYVTDPHRPEFN